MPTLGQVVSQVRNRLTGSGASTEDVTSLADPIDSTGTTLSVDSAQGIGPGIVEVGFEQMRVKQADVGGSSLVLWPFGRGYNGTTATAHLTGEEVTIAPRWAASTVASEVNGVLTEIYPALYAVKTVEAPYTSWRDGVPYTLPADAVGVVAVFVPSVSGTWTREDSWRYEPDAGRYLEVGHVAPGSAVRVVYAARPGLFDLNGATDQDFETVTGLPDRMADLLALGVAVRLAPFGDLVNLTQRGAEARADGREQGLGTQVGRSLSQEFQLRLAQETLALQNEHPIRLHRTKGGVI